MTSTPIVQPDAPIDNRLKGPPIPVSTVIVKYADGSGKIQTSLAVVVPGGDVYLFVDTAGNLSLRPAQKWLKDSIVKSMDTTDKTTQV